MSSYCDPIALPMTRALLREQPNDPQSDKKRPKEYWKCVLKGVFEASIVYQVAFLESGPLHQSGLTFVIYYVTPLTSITSHPSGKHTK